MKTSRRPNLWHHRWLFTSWVQRDFTVRYRQSALGLGWALIQPLGLVAVYGVVFGRVLHVPSEHGPYLLFAYCGMVPWTFVSTAISTGATAMGNAMPVISKVYFPREVVPLSAVSVAGVDLTIATFILLVAAPLSGHPLHLPIVALPLVFVALGTCMAAGAVFLSVFTVFVRDLRHVLPIALQVLFIASPVMYSASLIPSSMRDIYNLNPVAVAITMVRRIVLEGRWPSGPGLVVFTAGGVIALIASIRYVRSVEQRFPDVA